MYSSHLFHYALVNEEFGHNRDITSSILPLLKPLLADKEGEKYQPDEIAAKVSNAYGIDMHPYVAEDLSESLVNEKWLKKLGENRNTKKEEYEILKVSTEESEENDLIFSVIKSIIEVYKKTAKEYFFNADIREPEVDYEWEFSRRLAHSIIEKDANSNTNFEDILDYAFAQTIAKFYELGGREYEIIESAYSGAILAEVVLSIREPSVEIENIKDKKFYIDAPLLINAVGFNDEYLVSCTKELIKYVLEHGGIVTTTAAYIEEAETTLRAGVKSYVEKSRIIRPLTRFLMKNPKLLSKVQAAIGNLQYLLTREGFNLEKRLINVTKREQSQTFSSFRTHLSENLSWIKVDETMEHDVEAILHVVSDYNYHSFKSFAESKSFLITPNDRLVSDTVKTLQQHGNFKTHEMSPILSERKFAVLMWVLTGSKSEQNLSSLSLLTNCSKAMKGHDLLINKVKSFFDDLDADSAELYERVVTNDRLLHTMVKEVGGNSELINKNSFAKYVKKAEDSIQKEIDEHVKTAEVSQSKLRLARQAITAQSKKYQEKVEKEKTLIEEIAEVEKKEKLAKQMAFENQSKARAEMIRAVEAEKNALQLKEEKATLSEEVDSLKDELVKTRINNLNRRRSRYKTFIEIIMKLLIIIIGCWSIYKLNSYTSPMIVNYISEATASSIAFFIGLAYTYVAPQWIFDQPVNKFSTYLSYKIIKEE